MNVYLIIMYAYLRQGSLLLFEESKLFLELAYELLGCNEGRFPLCKLVTQFVLPLQELFALVLVQANDSRCLWPTI